MPSCKEVTRIIAGDELEGAGLGKRLSVWFHLLMCRHCRRYLGQIRAIGRAARDVYGRRTPPGEVERLDRIKSELLGDDRDEPGS